MVKKIILIIFICIISSCNKKAQEETVIEVQETTTSEQEPTKPEETEIWEPKPPVVTPGLPTEHPSDAIVLFDGKNLDEWVTAKDSTAAVWDIHTDGSMTVKNGSGDIQTKRNFGDVQLHIEWRSSSEIRADGQARSNSGVYLQNRYEIQVLDNNNNDTYVNGQVGSLYKQAIPLAMASVPTGEWNTYDMIFHAPVFDASGKRTKAGTITVIHNGVLIQDHVEIEGSSQYIGWPKNEAHGKAPIMLQDHNDNSGVSYRNIWVREL